ncbi:MAG TPA: ABC transporter permease [Ruminococcaceae bacterium]|nr:ABC transporter permease [Oscillospiraceae bacterium]
MTKAKRFFRKYGVAYLELLPFTVLFLIFTVLPVGIAVVLSFTNYNMFQMIDFVGINNYKGLFLGDEIFMKALGNTLLFAVIVGPAGYFLSFFAAWVLNMMKFRNGFALMFYAPSIISGVAMSVVWSYIFSPDSYGLLNNALLSIGIIDDPVLWTQDPNYILPVIILVSVWMSMGTGFLVFLAGLQNVNKEYYEAAAIDGISNKYQELKYITLPSMKPQLLFGAINAVTGAFGVYEVSVTLAGFPSPNYAGHTIVTHLYDYAFVRFQMGYACAVATVLFIMTFFIGRVVMNALTEKEEKAAKKR